MQQIKMLLPYILLFVLLTPGLGDDEVLDQKTKSEVKTAHSVVVEAGTG